MLRKLIFIFVLIAVMQNIVAEQVVIKMYTLKNNTYLGTVLAKDTRYGLLIVPNLKGLKRGMHGFHLHVNPSCAHHGQAAGGHLDPKKTGRHLGPYDERGHLGDLPMLYVNHLGIADVPELAPRLSVAQIRNHSLMIHSGGDTYSDKPEKLGGGGARVACGVIK